MFIDLVLCKHPVDPKRYLYIAPPFSHLEEGDDVVVECNGEEYCATVIDSKTVTAKSDEYNFILNVADAKAPLQKIIKELVYRRLEYTEEENELGNSKEA